MCDDETLVTDDPFAETKELMGGFDLRRRPRRGRLRWRPSTVLLVHTIEIRPFMVGLGLGE
jgi:hypothetical protein